MRKMKKKASEKLVSKAYQDPIYAGRHVVIIGGKIYARRSGESRVERTLALGAFELVDYAYFLEQQFFPAHDQLCAQQAALADRAWQGEALPEGAMAAQRAAMEDLYARCWGHSELFSSTKVW